MLTTAPKYFDARGAGCIQDSVLLFCKGGVCVHILPSTERGLSAAGADVVRQRDEDDDMLM